MRLLWLAALLFLAGCAGTNKSDYQFRTFPQIQAKVRANQDNFETMWNKWKYAGSDDKFDYIYEYKPGIFPTPNSNFQYYKLDPDQIRFRVKQDFAPDVKLNQTLFTE